MADEVTAALHNAGGADVIVNLRDSADARQIARLQSAVLSSLGREFHATHVYQRIPAFSGRVTMAHLERLSADPDVSLVQVAHEFSGQLLEAVPSVGVDRARERFGLTGRGVRVALFDSGVDTMHPDLSDAVVAQRCFTRGDCTPWFSNEGSEAQDEHGHGTAVAGTIASRGVTAPPGFAPEAELIAVRVQDDQNRGNEVDLVAAFEWVLAEQDALDIDVVALGMGTDVLFDDAAQCDARHPALARAIKNVVDAGVIVVGASGNRGSSTGLTAPGCNSGVITAAATYDADVGAQPPSGGTFEDAWGPSFADCRDEVTRAGQITCYSDTPPRVDVVVPGGPMLTTRRGGGTVTQWGTSQSAAVMGGIAALLRQCAPGLTGEDFKRALVETGQPRVDAKSGRSFPFVRLPEAARVACPDLAPDEPPAADGGTTPETPPPGVSTDAGSGTAAPANPTQSPERRAGSLLGRYTGGSRAESLGEQRPVDTRAPAAGNGDARRDAGSSDPEAGPEASSRGERVSSCSVHGAPQSSSRALHGWFVALLWLGGWSLRRARRR